MSGRNRARFLIGAAIALAAVALFPASAGSHANLVSSSPADGETLQATPESVTLTFTEDPEPSLSSMGVLDASGAPLSSGQPRVVAGDARSLTLPLPPLEQGGYTVTWRVVSRVDGHATAGAFAFGVGEAPSAVSPHSSGEIEAPPPSPLEVAGRWAILAGLAALVGGTVTTAVVLGPTRSGLGVYLFATWALSAVGLGLLAYAQVDAAQTGLGSFLSTSIGRGLLWRAVGLAVAGGGLAGAALGGGRRQVWSWVAAIGAATTILAHVAHGHAAAASPAWIQVAAQWVHVMAVGLWIGGLAALLLGIRGQPASETGPAVRRFSTLAGFTLLAVAGTGVARALNQVRSLDGLISTSYGRLVLLKVGLLVVLVGLGAVNRYRNVPRAEENVTGLRRVSRVEVSVAAVVLAAAALLATLSPPSSSTAASDTVGRVRLVARGSDFATSVRVLMEVEPGLPGRNVFTARVTDYDTGRPVGAERVSLGLSYLSGAGVGDSSFELARVGDGIYRASAGDLSIDGRWEVTVLIQETANSVEVPLVVATPCRAEAVPAEGAPTIYTLPLHSGGTVQGYVDPGTDGINQVHITLFDASGAELPLEARPELTAWRPDIDALALEVQRLGPGHFVSNQDLDAGRWRFEFALDLGEHGSALGCFDETIRGR